MLWFWGLEGPSHHGREDVRVDVHVGRWVRGEPGSLHHFKGLPHVALFCQPDPSSYSSGVFYFVPAAGMEAVETLQVLTMAATLAVVYS